MDNPKKLLKTVAIAAQAAIETGEIPGEAIEGICQKHASLHVSPEAYSIVGEHLLGTISDLLTKDENVLSAWGMLYKDIANAFVTREQEIANDISNTPGAWLGRRSFTLTKKEQQSSIITRFTFTPTDGGRVPTFAAGKFTTLWIPKKDGEEGPYGTYHEQPRHYTLNIANENEDPTTTLSISVKKEGVFSRILHQAEVGTEWDLSAPYGCFVMAGVEALWLSAVDAPVIFLSAGVGITPVLAMLESIYVTRPATWLHAAANGNVHAYRDRLREIAAVRSGALQRRVWYTNPTIDDGPPGGDENKPALWNLAKYHYHGMMDLKTPEITKDPVLLHLDNPNAHYFMCGPSGFMDVQRQSLLDLGVSESNIHWEGFA